MEAFERAWALLKTPFDPASIKRLPDSRRKDIGGEYGPKTHHWESEFVHPKTGERSMYDTRMSQSLTDLDVRERGGKATAEVDRECVSDGGGWFAGGISVPEEERGAGIGSSMYDLIAHLIAGGSDSPVEGGRFHRDDEQSPEAEAMWERKNMDRDVWRENLEDRWRDYEDG